LLPALPTACAHVAAFWTIAWSVIFAQALGGFLDARARQGSRFQKPSARASRTRRDVIGRATHAPFEGQATGRRVPSARALRPASVSILRARPVGGTQECAATKRTTVNTNARETKHVANQRLLFAVRRQTKSEKKIQGKYPSTVPHAANVKSRLKMR